jgi:prepilin-type N-terminal cleavage/methylation domain-containing protein
MKKEPTKYSLKGFTIAEVLVTLALTSIAISLSYGTLTYVQKLFNNYQIQNKFINQYTDLKKRLDHEALKANVITEENENSFRIKRDSTEISFQILEKTILFKQQERCDTFRIESKNIKKTYESMKNPLWENKLLKSISFETEFTRQKFIFHFYKNHDASVKLELEQTQ